MRNGTTTADRGSIYAVPFDVKCRYMVVGTLVVVDIEVQLPVAQVLCQMCHGPHHPITIIYLLRSKLSHLPILFFRA